MSSVILRGRVLKESGQETSPGTNVHVERMVGMTLIPLMSGESPLMA